MPNSFTILIDDQRAYRKLAAFSPRRLGAALKRAMDQENELTVSAIIQNRLSFPRTSPSTLEGLRVQSGRLRRSIRKTPAQIVSGPSTVGIGSTQVVSAIGSNVAYAGVHEYGFSGTVQVPGHTRRSARKRSFKFGGKAMSRNIEGRDVFVRPHSRQVNLPARRFISRTIEARLPRYVRAIDVEIAKEWNAATGGTD